MQTQPCPHRARAIVGPQSAHLPKLHGIQPSVLYHGLEYFRDTVPLDCSCTLDLTEWTEFAEDGEREDLNTGFPNGALDYTDYLAKPTTFQPAEAIWSTLPEECGNIPDHLLQASIKADELGLKELLLHFATRVLTDVRKVSVGQAVVAFLTPRGMKTSSIDLRHVQLSLLVDLWERPGNGEDEDEEMLDKYEAEQEIYCTQVLQKQYELFLYQFGRLIHDHWMVSTDWSGGSVPTTDQINNFLHVMTKHYADILADEALEATQEEDYSSEDESGSDTETGVYEDSENPDDPQKWPGHNQDEAGSDVDDTEAEQSHCPSIRAKILLRHLLLGMLRDGGQRPALFGADADPSERLRLLKRRNECLNRLNMAVFLMFEVTTEILCKKKGIGMASG